MDEVSRIRGRVTSRDGTPVAYERYGDGGGPPLVLVAGARGTAESGRPLAGLLARHFSVVVYDRRERGPYAVEREIEDLAAVLAAAGPGAAVHGTGTGGALALAAAAAGLPVEAVSVYEPPAHEPYAREGGPWPRASARAARAAVQTTHAPAYGLAGVRARVLVVDGGASPAEVRRAARALAAALPRARHRTLTGQTHEVAPHVLAPVLEGFFSGERETAGIP
ncbi:alpha/beta hydrolase [Streptomyces sp. NPDC001744]|uniref:alpha/beta hydrolase n=1 Tax=Streptomyces sp. NPDC001744 TaxID=3364606 RepID=UPI00367A44D3